MSLSLLRITDFRNLAQINCQPDLNGINIISGCNGSGKTSLLEAIYYLGHGKSFRTATSSRLIRHSTDKFIIFAQIQSETHCSLPIGIERGLTGAMGLRVAENNVSNIAEMAAFLPIRLINSHSHALLESGPSFRRKYIDWGLFYQNDSFLSCWRSFERTLKQRNIILKESKPKNELNGWTQELIKHGLLLNHLRIEYLQQLKPILTETIQYLLGISDLQLIYQPGWDDTLSYAEILNGYYHEEYRYGHTLYGPHRADIDIKVGDCTAKHFLSRGQQKLLICAMILAQGMLLAETTKKSLIYLIDDLPSELDWLAQQKLISLLAQQQTQIFLTTVENEAICHFVKEGCAKSVKVFHVEHGSVTEARG